MRVGRFTRRAGLRAALAAGLAAPWGREAALAAAAAGSAQEQPAAGVVLGVGAALSLARRPGAAGRALLGVGLGLATRAMWPVASKEPAAVAPHREWAGLDPAPDGRGLGVVVNPGAGSSRNSGDDPAKVLAEELPGAEVVVLDDPADLPDELHRLARGGARALGVAGGDGSINTAAAVALHHGLPLAVVPAGTLNHLARDLGVETVDDAVAAVRAGTAIEVDVARIAGRPFLNTASFGSYTEIVDAREQLEAQVGKWPAMAVAVARVLRHGTPCRVVIDGDHQDLWAVFIGNCRYLPAGMAPTWRERLDDGRLDVRVAAAGHPFSRARLVAAAVTGRLHRSPLLRTWTATNLRVRSLDGPMRLARDGETFDGDVEFDITKSGERLAIYTPRPADPSE
jgi:undecaprenyl-diphosphatase